MQKLNLKAKLINLSKNWDQTDNHNLVGFVKPQIFRLIEQTTPKTTLIRHLTGILTPVFSNPHPLEDADK